MKSFLSNVRALSLAAFAVLTVSAGARAQFSYTFYPNDATIDSAVTTDFAIVGFAGGSYNDDFTRNFTGATSPTVQVVNGANVLNEMDVFNHSVVNVTGGTVTFLFPYDDSTVHFSGGDSLFALVQENAVIHMTGGLISDLEGQGKAITVSGGQVDTLVANVQTDSSGANIGSSIVDVFGGSIGQATAFNLGVLNVRGGTYADRIIAAFGGTVNVYGTGLSATLLDPDFSIGGASSYRRYALSGILADGTALTSHDLLVRNDHPGDGSFQQSSFNLFPAASAAPEPGALALLLTGLLPFAVAARVARRGGV